jgi:hypothetical protein
MKKRQLKPPKKNKRCLPNSAVADKTPVDSDASISQPPFISSYPGNLLNSLLLNEPQEHKDITLIEQCLIKTNDSVALIWVYGPENK